MPALLDLAEFLDDAPAPAFRLRDYQLKTKQAITDGWQEPGITRQLAVLATGLGKTCTFAVIAREEVAGVNVLIIAHRDELIDQAIDKCREWGLYAAKEKADDRASQFDRCVVASIQTLRGARLESWPANYFGLIIIDEAHHSAADSYLALIAHFPRARVLGFTATPDRMGRKQLGAIFQRIAFDYGLREACYDGWLVRPTVEAIPVKVDIRGIADMRRPDGTRIENPTQNQIDEFTAQKLTPFLSEMCRLLVSKIGRRKTLVFVPSVQIASMASSIVNNLGVRSTFVSGECPDRTEKIMAYSSDRVQVMFNAQLLGEGYDLDSISCVSLWRATKSTGFMKQAYGRGTRPLKSIIRELNSAGSAIARQQLILASSKPDLLILDPLWLYEKHDLCTPARLVARDDSVAEAMAGAQGDLLESEKKAERDLLEKLEKDVRKNARRQAKVIDPLIFATALHNYDAATYEPETDHDAEPASPRQLSFLRRQAIDVSKVTCFGHAQLLVKTVMGRFAGKKATVRQLNFLSSLHIAGVEMPRANPDFIGPMPLRAVEFLSQDEATAAIEAKIGPRK